MSLVSMTPKSCRPAFKKLLNPDGIYGYVISHTFYDNRARPFLYKDWNTDWLSLAFNEWNFAFNTRAPACYGFLFSDVPHI